MPVRLLLPGAAWPLNPCSTGLNPKLDIPLELSELMFIEAFLYQAHIGSPW